MVLGSLLVCLVVGFLEFDILVGCVSLSVRVLELFVLVILV